MAYPAGYPVGERDRIFDGLRVDLYLPAPLNCIVQFDDEFEPGDVAKQQPQARPEELRLLEALLFASAEPLDQAALQKRMPDGVDVTVPFDGLVIVSCQSRLENVAVTDLSPSIVIWHVVARPAVTQSLPHPTNS